jgi:hypothetical protein
MQDILLMCIWTISMATGYTNTAFRKHIAFVFCEDKSNLHSKRRVCVTSDDGNSPNILQ